MDKGYDMDKIVSKKGREVKVMSSASLSASLSVSLDVACTELARLLHNEVAIERREINKKIISREIRSAWIEMSLHCSNRK